MSNIYVQSSVYWLYETVSLSHVAEMRVDPYGKDKLIPTSMSTTKSDYFQDKLRRERERTSDAWKK